MVILTNKEDWQIYPGELAQRSGTSKATIERYLKLFEQLGYARYTKKSLGRGKGIVMTREFSDRKIFTKHKN